jgi:ech hydrogenase subunit F
MSIMKFSKVVLKSLVSKPATLLYPIKKREFFERTRGHIDIEVDKCIFCGICVKRCPTNAINVERSEKLWAIERLRCIQCSSCVDNCPKKCLYMENEYTAPSTTGSVKDEFNA